MLERRVSLATVLVTFCLLLAGGLVHSTGSGLACPDWPLCNGEFFPKMTGGVEFEHTHRLIALSTALLTTLLAIILWRKNPQLKSWGVLAVSLILFQAGLGALTVIYKLPTIISATHLAVAMLFFSLLVSIAVKVRNLPTLYSTEHARELLAPLRPWIVACVVFTYLQIVLGAVVRHTGSGGVCTTIPLCENSLWPMTAHPAVRLHMAHRLLGVFLGVLVFATAIRISKTLPKAKVGNPTAHLVWQLAALLPFLVVAQIGLGVMSVVTLLHIFPVTAHLGVGALMLGILVTLWNIFPHGSQSLMGDLVSLSKARLGTFVILVMAVSYGLAAHSLHPTFSHTLATFCGMIFLVAGGGFLNAYLERHSDGLMARTKDRPLPAGRISPGFVLGSGTALSIAGVFILSFLVNPLTGFLGAIACISYALVYTPLKPKTSLAAIIGAIPGALPPLLGWTAVVGHIDWVGAVLFFILYFWQLPHFLAIAVFRKQEYDAAGLKIIPSEQGSPATRKLMIRYCVLLIPVTLLLVPLGVAGKVYFFVALLLGLTYLGFSLYGLTPLSGVRWAKNLFYFSLAYLPALFLTLLFDCQL